MLVVTGFGSSDRCKNCSKVAVRYLTKNREVHLPACFGQIYLSIPVTPAKILIKDLFDKFLLKSRCLYTCIYC